MTKIYIAGPLAGTDFAQAHLAFAEAQEDLEAQGFDVVSPLNVVPDGHAGPCPPGYEPGEGVTMHTSSACFMRADLRALLTCEAIFMLAGWERSRGARVEWSVAIACGMQVLYQQAPDALSLGIS